MSSTQRIVDHVPLVIEHELNQNFAEKLRSKLVNAIFEDSRTGRVNFEYLLSEDPIIASKRKNLEDRISRLLLIKAKLDQFWGGRVHVDLSEAEDVEVQDLDYPDTPKSDLGSYSGDCSPYYHEIPASSFAE
jgi:hypothetical protein